MARLFSQFDWLGAAQKIVAKTAERKLPNQNAPTGTKAAAIQQNITKS